MSYLDPERVERLRAAMRESKLDALLCSVPQNVLMLTQYWPVLGASVALLTTDTIALLVPEDERDLAEQSSADVVHTFATASLQRLTTANEAVWPALSDMCSRMGGLHGQVGVELCGYSTPPAYVAIHRYGASQNEHVRATLPSASFCPADDLLQRVGAVKTSFELDKIRKACAIAAHAFQQAKAALVVGITERDAAQGVQATLFTSRLAEPEARCGGRALCMSGPNSATAYYAYARTRGRKLESTDLIMLHCNSYYDGMWTDITRTFTFGEPQSDQQKKIYDAVARARNAGLSVIRPGVRAGDVDRSARNVMEAAGLGDAFKHQTGHGVGFEAINHNAFPRIHPASEDVLQAGMTFNIEPAAYLDGIGGIRHCDLVVVTEHGCEVLSDFQNSPEELQIFTPRQ